MAGPCTLTDGRITACEGLEAVLEAPHGRGVRSRGLIFRSMVDRETRAFTRNLVEVKSGERSIIANYCPFCGTQIRADDQEDAP